MRRIDFDILNVNPGCASTHVTRLRGPRASEPHTHDFHEAFLVLEGSGVHHLNRRRIPLRAGQLVVLRPEDAHWFSAAREQNLVFVNIAVSASWWQAFHTVHGLTAWPADQRGASLGPADVRQLGRELGAAVLTSNPTAVLQAWTHIRACCLAPAGRRPSPPPTWLETLRRKIMEASDELAEPISYWQRLAGRSPEHLARSSRRFYGVTFSELLNQARTERARFLLRTSDDKITTIAFDCGFQNLAYFYRVFARLTGRTPSQLRREETGAVPF